MKQDKVLEVLAVPECRIMSWIRGPRDRVIVSAFSCIAVWPTGEGMEGVEAALAALGSRALSSPGDGAAELASSDTQGIEAACAVIPRFGQ